MRDTCRDVRLAGHDFRMPRLEEHVVERQRVEDQWEFSMMRAMAKFLHYEMHGRSGTNVHPGGPAKDCLEVGEGLVTRL